MQNVSLSALVLKLTVNTESRRKVKISCALTVKLCTCVRLIKSDNSNKTAKNYDVLSKSKDILMILKNEPVHGISNKMVCATSKASDQPAHTRSLIRAFARRFSIL